MAKLVLNNVSKHLSNTQVLSNISLDVNDGEFVVFVGPSGCGKSTLLRIIAGLDQEHQGEVNLEGNIVNDYLPSEREIAMVFQSYALYPHLTVAENIGFPLKMLGKTKAEIKNSVYSTAEILKITELLERKPNQLSGGQKQRVAMGRALVRKPKIFLFDEPLSNLDADLRFEMRLELQKLHQSIKITMVYVTHDQVEAMTLADKIVVLQAGKIEQIGTPDEIYKKPVNTFVARFVGMPKINFIPVKFIKVHKEKFLIELGADSKLMEVWFPREIDKSLVGENLLLGIRPEDIFIPQAGSPKKDLILPFDLEVSEYLGSITYCYGLCLGNRVVFEQKKNYSLDTNTFNQIAVNLNNIYLFDSEGKNISVAKNL